MNTYKVSNVSTGAIIWLLCLFIGTAPLIGGSGQIPTTALVLKNQAVVSSDIVKIKDIAQMDNSTRNRIGNLVIAAAPELGAATTISKKEIYEKLIGNGFTLTLAQLKGAASVKILRRGLVIKPAHFTEHIRQYITTHSKWKDGVTVKVVSAKDIVIPESGVRWQLMPANGQDFFGNILFKIKAYSNKTNEELYENWIVAKLTIQKSVAISNRTIQKNEPISESDIRWETREITVFTKDAILSPKEILGQKSGRIIRANSVITAKLMAKKFLVRRGGMATLVAKINNVKATSQVKAMSNGSYGDMIRVMNTRSKKIISATVKGRNLLEVNVE
jgi:flagellar basal body P-ring formation protein FlgA